ncbi:unnamed protein product, partial [Brassica oleracea]
MIPTVMWLLALTIARQKEKSKLQDRIPADAITVRTDAVWLPVRNLAGLGWVVLSSPCNIPHKKHLEFVASPLMAEGLALREAVRSCALD